MLTPYISQLATLSASAVAADVRAMDEEFAAYATLIEEDDIDGDTVIALIKDDLLNAMFRDLRIFKQSHREKLTLHFTCLYMQKAASQAPRTDRVVAPTMVSAKGDLTPTVIRAVDDFSVDAWVASNEDHFRVLQATAAREKQPMGPDLSAALKEAGVRVLRHRRQLEQYLRSGGLAANARGKAVPVEAGGSGLQGAVAAVLAEREAKKKAAEDKEAEERFQERKNLTAMSGWQVQRQTFVRAAGTDVDIGADVARCKAIMANDSEWIAFSAHEARWVPISADPRIKECYSTTPSNFQVGPNSSTTDGTEAWLNEASSCLHNYVLHQLVVSEKRAACFRALGRGWIFITLSSSGGSRRAGDAHDRYHARTRFRWWFEGADRIACHRQDDIAQLEFADGLGGLEAEHYLYGTEPKKEQVFVIKGLHPVGRPMIAIIKMRTDWSKLRVWAPNEEIQQKLEAPTMTDEERQAKAEKVKAKKAEKKRARKARDRAKEREAAEAGPEREARDEERAREAAMEFEALLEELKVEDGLVADDAPESGLVTYGRLPS